MTTREEIEATASRYEAWINNDMPTPVRTRYERDGHILVDRHIIADAYLAERQQRERDQQPPTREMFERLGAVSSTAKGPLVLGPMRWFICADFPTASFELTYAKVDTVAKLRAACLLLGIDTEGIL